MSYLIDNLREIAARGPYPGEDFFRMKVTGDGETKWCNVTPEKLAAIIETLEGMEPKTKTFPLVSGSPSGKKGVPWTPPRST
jgi:hypothetical protein